LNYLNILKGHLRLNPEAKDDLLREIRGHIEDKISDLRESGMSESEASDVASKLLGSPQVIAQQIYEVYSQGSWRQTVFAILPHFLTAALFALHWWTNPIWLPIILFMVIGTVIYGWCHGRPAWLFSWLGFLLIPVVVAGVMLIYLPGDLAWLATIVYVPVAIFILISVAKQILKIDWLFVSLMLLPVPIVIGWLMVLSTSDTFLGSELICEVAWWISLSFTVLALAVATFIRVRQRWMKTVALLACSTIVLIVVALVGVNSLNFWACLFLSLLMLLHLFLPAWLERRIRNNEEANNPFKQ
jgi:hypothetical protein